MKIKTIDEIMKSEKLPKMHKVITIELETLRGALGSNLGWMEVDAVVTRKVRRVMGNFGWKWQLVTEYKGQRDDDYYFETDREMIDEINYEYRLTV